MISRSLYYKYPLHQTVFKKAAVISQSVLSESIDSSDKKLNAARPQPVIEQPVTAELEEE